MIWEFRNAMYKADEVQSQFVFPSIKQMWYRYQRPKSFFFSFSLYLLMFFKKKEKSVVGVLKTCNYVNIWLFLVYGAIW